jgi:hypothetical protein
LEPIVAKRKHPFDVVAEKLETMAAKPAAEQDPSPDYWELHFPLARREATPIKVDPTVYDGGQEGLGPDGFPKVPIPKMKLKGRGGLTDVVLTELPVSWSVGYLYSEKALAVFKQFELGIFREYPVNVSGGKDVAHPLTYLLIRNFLPHTAIDFARSEFYVTDMVSIPQGPVTITSAEDLADKRKLAQEGQLNGYEKFSRIDYKRLVLLQDHLPTADLFRLERGLGIRVYISTRLKEAIEKSGITGLEIRENKRLFAGR